MLDKSLPYAEIWMLRANDLPVPEHSLPAGFHFEFYQTGDEAAWAAIETAVLEFDEEEQALDYFQRTFTPYPKALRQRMLFVVNAVGEKVGTCTAWWKETPAGERYPLVHWVAVTPDYQGKGLAKAMMARTLSLLQQLEENSPVCLHTQTWSHPAIRLYQQLGFELSDKNLDGSPNPDYETVLAVLAHTR